MRYDTTCPHCGDKLVRVCEGVYKELTCSECFGKADIEIKNGVVKILRTSKFNTEKAIA